MSKMTLLKSARKELIDAGYEIVASGSGRNAPDDKRSKLYAAIQRAKRCGYTDVTYRLGARVSYLPSLGWQFVVGGKK